MKMKRGIGARRGRPPQIRRQAEKVVSREVKEVVPDSAMYSQLLDFERRLDTTLMRKRMDVYEAMRRPASSKMKRVLRLFVSNTHNNQPGDMADEANPPEWTLSIEGRLLDDPQGKQDARLKRRMSTFVNRLFVEFDKSQYPFEDNVVEWHRNHAVVSDGFEITRRGNAPVRTTIMLDFESFPPKFKLAPALADLLGTPTATRTDALSALWQYIKSGNFHDPLDRDYFLCDPYLQRVFRTDRLKFSDIAQALPQLLLPADPLVFYFEINVDPAVPRKQQIYDIEIETDDNFRGTLNSLMLSANMQADLKAADDQTQELLQDLERTRVKRDFMISFARDPQQFLTAWVSSQVRDLAMSDAAAAMQESMRTSAYYAQPWSEPAAQRYFASAAAGARVATQQQQQELPR